MKLFVSSLFLLLLLSLYACSNQEPTNEGETNEKDEEAELFISAATSLSEAMKELVKTFKQENQTTQITVNYGSSGKLSQQIQQGAPVDVFVSADKKRMDYLTEQELIVPDSRINFTKNALAIIAHEDNRLNSKYIEDINFEKIDQIAIGNPDSVPAGSYAKEVLESLNSWEDIQEKLVYAKDVRQVVTYVESENTDIGFVYTSDLMYGNRIKEIAAIDKGMYSPIVYPAAIMATSNAVNKAEEFISFLQTDDAQQILLKHGFHN